MLGDGVEQALLVSEQAVDRGRLDAGRLGDAARGDGARPLLVQQPRRRLDDAGAELEAIGACAFEINDNAFVVSLLSCDAVTSDIRNEVPMIIVTGATGQLGSQIVERLLERVPAEQVGVSVRDPARASALAARGVRVRRGDFADPSTLDAAFEGASQVLVISIDRLGDEAVAQHKAAIDAAYRAGAERVLYTSHQAANPDSHFAPARDHAAVEAYLEQSGRPYTSLRNGYYTTSLQFHLGNATETGELRAPVDGPVSWTAPADLATAAAAILAGEATFDGPTPPLTASATVGLEEVASILSVRHVVIDDEDFVSALTSHGTPEPIAQMLLGSYLASRAGEFAVTDPTLAKLIGREPQSVRAALQP